MKATLSELHRQTGQVVRPVIDGGKEVTITVHGIARAAIVPVKRIDRQAAAKALVAIGPVAFTPRK